MVKEARGGKKGPHRQEAGKEGEPDFDQITKGKYYSPNSQSTSPDPKNKFTRTILNYFLSKLVL